MEVIACSKGCFPAPGRPPDQGTTPKTRGAPPTVLWTPDVRMGVIGCFREGAFLPQGHFPPLGDHHPLSRGHPVSGWESLPVLGEGAFLPGGPPPRPGDTPPPGDHHPLFSGHLMSGWESLDVLGRGLSHPKELGDLHCSPGPPQLITAPHPTLAD